MVTASAERASLIRSLDDGGPLHIGVLLGNVPEYLFWLGAAAMAGAVVVGINPTRRGEALAGDVRRTDCRLVVTDADGAALLDGLDLGVAQDRVLRIDRPDYDERLRAHRGADPRQVVASAAPVPEDLYLLLFTSGTTGAPKAVRCTQGRLAAIAVRSAGAYGFDRRRRGLLHHAPVPRQRPDGPVGPGPGRRGHGGPGPSVHRLGLRVRHPPLRGHHLHLRGQGAGLRPGHAARTRRCHHHPASRLRHRGLGGRPRRLRARFGCVLTEGYGSSEGGVAISRTPDTPVGSLGRPSEDVVIMDPEALTVCPPARFDEAGRLTNGDAGRRGDREPLGTRSLRGLLRRRGGHGSPDAARVVLDGRPGLPGRGRVLLLRRPTGRLDAGRLGEPDAPGPIERVLVRFEPVATVAVYSVPDPRSGDQVMAALELLPGQEFEPEAFGSFLAAQADLGTKWAPSFVRVTAALPQTASGKVTKQPLRADGWWRGGDEVFCRRGAGLDYVPMDETDRQARRAEFARHGRDHLVGG